MPIPSQPTMSDYILNRFDTQTFSQLFRGNFALESHHKSTSPSCFLPFPACACPPLSLATSHYHTPSHFEHKLCTSFLLPLGTLLLPLELVNRIICEGKIPDDWKKSWMVTVYKGKGDSLDCGSYRG